MCQDFISTETVISVSLTDTATLRFTLTVKNNQIKSNGWCRKLSNISFLELDLLTLLELITLLFFTGIPSAAQSFTA